MEHFNLKEQYEKLRSTRLPDKYTHFISDLRMPQDADISEGSLYSLIEGVPFDRPIQPLSSDTLRAAFTLKPVVKTPSITLKTDKKQDIVPASATTQGTNGQQGDEDIGDNAALKREKKAKKKKKSMLRRTVQWTTSLILT